MSKKGLTYTLTTLMVEIFVERSRQTQGIIIRDKHSLTSFSYVPKKITVSINF